MQNTIYNGDADITGGDIIQITDLLQQLLYVHTTLAERENEYEKNVKLTTNVLETMNQLFLSSIGWKEISSNQSRYQTSSNLLTTSDSVGYLLFKLSALPSNHTKMDNAKSASYTFENATLQMNASIFSNNSIQPTLSCQVFDKSEICIPSIAFEHIVNEPIIEVAVQYKIDTEANLFPTNTMPTNKNAKTAISFQLLQDNNSLNNYLIGFSINNGTLPNNDTLTKHPVVIKFFHDMVKVSIQEN